MGKTLNHYSQQIKALAPDSLVLDRARDLGLLLLEAKAAVLAAGRRWSDWLETDCALSTRTAQRFMAIASRWDEPAFADARRQRPDLPLREADRVLAASSTRKRPASRTPSEGGFCSGGQHVHYYCPVCTMAYASTVLEKKPVVRGLLCSGSLKHPHPPTATVPSLITVGDHLLKLTPRDTSSYYRLPVIVPLLQQVCPELVWAGMKITAVETSSGGSSVNIRGEDDPAGQLPDRLSLQIDKDGLVEKVFIGQPCAGNLLAATRGDCEFRGTGRGYLPLWQLLQPHIPWREPTVPLPTPSDSLTESSPAAAPLSPTAAATTLADAVAAAVAEHGATWPRGLAAAIARQHGVSNQAVDQRKKKAVAVMG